jgi:hypothetical protein
LEYAFTDRAVFVVVKLFAVVVEDAFALVVAEEG